MPLQRNIDVELEIKMSGFIWLRQKGGTDSLVFQISANPTYYERSGKIVVIGSGPNSEIRYASLKHKRILLVLKNLRYYI